MSRKSHRRSDQARPAANASLFFGSEHSRQAQRKERQLCRQVHEAIYEALSTLRDEVLADVWIVAVEPAPDASRLAIIVQGPKDVAEKVVRERLAGVQDFLRTEVAEAITRKRVPTLTYEVLPPEVQS